MVELNISMIGDTFLNNEDSLKVILRIRPPNEDDIDNINYFEIVDNERLNVKIPKNSWTYKNIKRSNIENMMCFEFSNIYDWSCKQNKIFNSMIDNIILDFLSGRNSLLFTYGITNSGKTYTLIGNKNDPGILPRSIEYIFSCLVKHDIGNKDMYNECPYKGIIEKEENDIKIHDKIKKYILENDLNTTNLDNNDSFIYEEKSEELNLINYGIDVIELPMNENTVYYIYLSIAEIYNEQIYDLLDTDYIENMNNKDYIRKGLSIRGDQKNGFYVKNLKSILVCNPYEAIKILQFGLNNRSMASTNMNINSSRSHVIYTLKLIRATTLPNGMVITRMNQLCFVDLAGAERQNNTLSEGYRLKEASNINKSLLYLNRCIRNMRDFRFNYDNIHNVCYRECRLTQLLQPFFTGKTRMVLLVNISPSINVFDDTISVLKFSSITRDALNRPIDFELDKAIKIDHFLNNNEEDHDENFQLMNHNKIQLIQMINDLKTCLLESKKNCEARDSIVREEMSQFTMDALLELDECKEKEIDVQRKVVEETYLTKIDILTSEIKLLKEKIKICGSKKYKDVINERDRLSSEVEEYKNKIKQLRVDFLSFKNEKELSIKELQDEQNRLKDYINNEIIKIESANFDYEKIKKEVVVLQNSNSQNIAEINEKTNEINELTKVINDYKSNIERINIDNKLYHDNVINSYNLLCDALNIPQESLTNVSKLYIVNEYIVQLISKYRKSSQDLERINKQYHVANSINDTYKKSISSTLSNISDIKNEMNLLNDIFENCQFQYKSNITNLSKHKSTLLQRYKENADKLRDVTNNVNEVNIKNADLAKSVEEKEKLIIDYEENMGNMNRHIKGLEVENEDLKAKSYYTNNNGNTNNNNEIEQLKLEIKSYKRLREDDLSHINKLEDIISERGIMNSPCLVKKSNMSGNILATKRSATNNENYPCVFSKKFH